VSFLDALRRSMEDNIVITHIFLLEYDPHRNIIHAFFEGKTDESFYGTFIRRIKPAEWKLKTYVCGNKDSVYYHFEKLSSKHKKHQPLLFFVDKDIEDIIPFPRPDDESIYVTDYYSVENYIVTGEAIEQVWSEIFRQSSGTPESDKLVQTFATALNEMHDVLLGIMSWVLLHRREEARPNLDCIHTGDYFKINDEFEVSRALNQEETIELLDKQTKIMTSEKQKKKIGQCKTELLAYQAKEVIRGHNEIDFFITFIKKLKNVAAKESGNKIKANIEITKANIIDIMGPRVAIPGGLEEFLQRHLQFEGALL